MHCYFGFRLGHPDRPVRASWRDARPLQPGLAGVRRVDRGAAARESVGIGASINQLPGAIASGDLVKSDDLAAIQQAAADRRNSGKAGFAAIRSVMSIGIKMPNRALFSGLRATHQPHAAGSLPASKAIEADAVATASLPGGRGVPDVPGFSRWTQIPSGEITQACAAILFRAEQAIATAGQRAYW